MLHRFLLHSVMQSNLQLIGQLMTSASFCNAVGITLMWYVNLLSSPFKIDSFFFYVYPHVPTVQLRTFSRSAFTVSSIFIQLHVHFSQWRIQLGFKILINLEMVILLYLYMLLTRETVDHKYLTPPPPYHGESGRGLLVQLTSREYCSRIELEYRFQRMKRILLDQGKHIIQTISILLSLLFFLRNLTFLYFFLMLASAGVCWKWVRTSTQLLPCRSVLLDTYSLSSLYPIFSLILHI